ncbi:MAG: phosphopantetheine-binding protein [Bdellovibrionota bacterium]
MSTAFDTLKNELLDVITEAVNMKNLDRSTVTPETPIMVEGLGLDSIDILEVVIALEKKFGVKIENNQNSRDMFKSVGALADYIEQNKKTGVEATP